MRENSVLPLVDSAFKPGEAMKTVESFENEEERNIALAELHYFSGRAKECRDIAEMYLTNDDIKIKLSACLLYGYSNITLGNKAASWKTFEEIKRCSQEAMEHSQSEETRAVCLFARYLAVVLLHLPVDELPDWKSYVAYLPDGIKLYAAYMLSHVVYLKGDYARSLGICQAALAFNSESYLIPMIYIYCMIAICHINLKNNDEAKAALLNAWEMARKDEFLEPFIEHQGLLQGLLESSVKKEFPEVYKRLNKAAIAFSRGWMAIHNPRTGNNVTAELTTMEFSIAMLASREWSNQEIAEHLKLSVNTIKQYLSTIYIKLNINKRDELKQYLLA